MTKVPALVLQGGGSLGAYEAGAYQAIYERITKIDMEKGENYSGMLLSCKMLDILIIVFMI
jgi:hypothetical protein